MTEFKEIQLPLEKNDTRVRKGVNYIVKFESYSTKWGYQWEIGDFKELGGKWILITHHRHLESDGLKELYEIVEDKGERKSTLGELENKISAEH